MQFKLILIQYFCVYVSMGLEFWTFRTVIAVLGKGLSEASFTTVILYTTELYPTVMRLVSAMFLFS